MFHKGLATLANRNEDILDLIRFFYDSIGGRACYSKHLKDIKNICCWLKRSLIRNKFRGVGALRVHPEPQAWSC